MGDEQDLAADQLRRLADYCEIAGPDCWRESLAWRLADLCGRLLRECHPGTQGVDCPTGSGVRIDLPGRRKTGERGE